MILDVAYVGSEAMHQLQRVNLNAIPYGVAFKAENQDPTKVAANPNAVLGNNAYDRDYLRPYPGFGDITLHAFGGTANYNSLQTTLQKRFSKGLSFSANHTWARSLGTSDDRGNYNRIDGLTRTANYALTALHRAHTFNFYYTWDVPSMFKGDSMMHTLLDGWQLSGATTMQTGSPYSPRHQHFGYRQPEPDRFLHGRFPPEACRQPEHRFRRSLQSPQPERFHGSDRRQRRVLTRLATT